MSICLGKQLKILAIILGKKYGLCNLQSWIKLLITSVMLLFVEKSQFW